MSEINPNPAGSQPGNTVRIFVSYAREDKRWLDANYRFSIVPFLMESLRRNDAVFWFDEALIGGDEFKRRIEAEIDQSQIALLIVTQHFLNSSFIESFEMPRIVDRAQRGLMLVVPILVEPCAWNDYPFLADRQMVPSSRPLIHYTESDAQWADVRFQILDGLKTQVKRIREDGERRIRDEIGRKDREEKERKFREEKERRDREEKERSEREEQQRKERGEKDREEQQRRDREEKERREREEKERRERDEKERKAREEKVRQERKGKDERKSVSPLFVWLRGRRLLIAIAALVCAIAICDFLFHLWFSHAGAKWTTLKSGASSTFYSIGGSANGRILFTCGSGSAFLNSTDGGLTWTNRNTGANTNCDSIFSTLDGRQIWTPATYSAIEKASGTFLTSEIFSSTDGGATWQIEQLTNAADWPAPQKLTTLVPHNLTAPASQDYHPLDLFAGTSSGGSRSSKPGSSSSPSSSKPVIDIKGIAGTPDGKRLWAAGDQGEIYESDDSGSTWQPRSSGIKANLSTVVATSDGSFIMAVGSGGAVVQSSDGTYWWTQASGVTTALKAVFVASNASTVCAVGEKGTILVSTDKGITWSTEGGGTLQDLQGVFGTNDGKHLWIVGNSGTIIESNDRGSNWHYRSSGTNANLRAIFGTSDGKRLWIVGENGLILESKSSIF